MRVNAPRIALGGVGLLVVSAVFSLGGGFVGLLAAGLTVALWYLASARYATVFGQVALVALVPTSSPVAVAAGECGLLVLLLDSLVAVDGTRRRFAVGTGCIAVAAAGTWLAYLGSGTLWVPTVVLVAVLGMASYGLHRYETVVRETLNERQTPAADAPASPAGVREAADRRTEVET